MLTNVADMCRRASQKKQFAWLGVIAVITLVFCVYANTLGNPFLWDDEEIVVANSAIRDWRDVSSMFTTDVFGGPIAEGNFYRPLQIFSYSIDYALWGLAPAGYHAINIILHALNAVLIFLLLMRLGMQKHLALLAAVLFAIHPINTEAVSYISGRGDVLFATFSLGSMLCFVNAARGAPRQYLASAGLFVLALFTKESAIALPLIVLAYTAILVDNTRKKEAFGAAGMLCVIAFAYAMVRLLGMGIEGTGMLSIMNEASLWQRLLTLPHVLITYLRLLVLPLWLHMEYLFLETSLMSPYILVGAPLLAGGAYTAVRYLSPRRLALFFVVWFFAGLAPFYNIFPVLAATIREHWAYLSGIAFFALAALVAGQALASRKAYARIAAACALVVLLPYYVYATVTRNADWSDPIRLYRHDLRYEPKSFLLHNNLGVELYRSGDMAGAKIHFENAISASPGGAYDVAHNNLGAVLEAEGDIDGAITEYTQSILLGEYARAYENLGRVYLQQGETGKARQVLMQGINRYPQNEQLRSYLDYANQQRTQQ